MPSEKFQADFFDLSPTEFLRLTSSYVSRKFEAHQIPEAIERIVRELRGNLPKEALEESCPFQRGRRKASDMKDDGQPLPHIWFGIYPGALTYFCGETGAGKSSLLYNLCIHAARNEPLWGIPFGLGRPIKILYVDPENSGDFDRGRDGLCVKKLDRIEQGKPALLEFHDGQKIDLSQESTLQNLQDVLIEENFDLLVLDPIVNLFTTKDENDNAEAAGQFNALRTLIKRTNVSVVVVHHTGRDTTSNFGRGATARLGMADVGVMLRCQQEKDDVDDDYGAGSYHDRDEYVRLRIIKNRIEPGKASIFLHMLGEDKFERVKFDEWKNATKTTESGAPKRVQAEEKIYSLLLSGESYSQQSIIEHMKKERIGESNTVKALNRLIAEKTVQVDYREKGGKAYYSLSGSAKVPAETSIPGWE